MRDLLVLEPVTRAHNTAVLRVLFLLPVEHIVLDRSLPLQLTAVIVLADNAVYLIWLPIMLGSKNLAGWFGRFTKVPKERLERM